jgi:hypothetical protein
MRLVECPTCKSNYNSWSDLANCRFDHVSEVPRRCDPSCNHNHGMREHSIRVHFICGLGHKFSTEYLWCEGYTRIGQYDR